MLCRWGSPSPGAEEWAIHDYEGFGPLRLDEFESLENVAKVAAGIARWLRKEGIYREVSAAAIKRVLARQEAATNERSFFKAEMARVIRASRAALDRVR